MRAATNLSMNMVLNLRPILANDYEAVIITVPHKIIQIWMMKICQNHKAECNYCGFKRSIPGKNNKQKILESVNDEQNGNCNRQLAISNYQ